jgi:hypothetical protein
MGQCSFSAAILFLGTRLSECSTSRNGRFTPWERTPGTYFIGGSVGLRAGLDTQEATSLASAWNRTPVIRPVGRRCTDCKFHRCTPMFRRDELPPSFLRPAHSSALNMETAYSSEMVIPLYQSRRCHILEDRSLNMHLCDNLFCLL